MLTIAPFLWQGPPVLVTVTPRREHERERERERERREPSRHGGHGGQARRGTAAARPSSIDPSVRSNELEYGKQGGAGSDKVALHTALPQPCLSSCSSWTER